MIIAKYYLYTASRKEELYFDAFLAILTNKIKIEKHKSKCWISNTIASWSRLRRFLFLQFDLGIGSVLMDCKQL